MAAHLCMQVRCVFSWSFFLASSWISRTSICPSLSTCLHSAWLNDNYGHRRWGSQILLADIWQGHPQAADFVLVRRTWDCMSIKCCCSLFTSVASSSVTCCRICCRSPATRVYFSSGNVLLPRSRQPMQKQDDEECEQRPASGLPDRAAMCCRTLSSTWDASANGAMPPG